MQIITPFNIYFNWKLIFQKYELWRLFTNFFYFGSLGRQQQAAVAGQ
jgi:Derlin-2/3